MVGNLPKLKGLRCDVISGRMHTSCYSYAACVEYGIAAKYTFYCYSQWSTQPTGNDIMSNLENGQSVPTTGCSWLHRWVSNAEKSLTHSMVA